MSQALAITQISELPTDIQILVTQSLSEGFRMIQRLSDEWASGKNCFDLRGEAFWEARISDRLVGVCGLNQDPYSGNRSIGRIRRMYISAEHRRLGAGHSLVEQAIQHASGHFQTIRLRSTAVANRFYEAVGFEKVNGNPEVTHQMKIF
jgi:GNAT superfamily N-acetyltransferase